MPDKAWKAYERRIAAQFNMKRALQKGTRAKEDIAPEEGIDAAPWIIDAKKRKRLEVWGWMRELCDYAAEKEKPPILVFQPWGKRRNYAVVDTLWFNENFRATFEFFNFIHFTRPEVKTFEKAWEEAVKTTTKKRQFPALAMHVDHPAWGISNYVCLNLDNLISLMKAKNMLKGENDA